MAEQLLGDAARALVRRIAAQDLLDVGRRALDLAEAARVEREQPRRVATRLVRGRRGVPAERLLQDLGEIGEAAVFS